MQNDIVEVQQEIQNNINREIEKAKEIEREIQRANQIERDKENQNVESEVNKKRQQVILKTRSKTNDMQEKNAAQMITNNDRLLGKANIGDTVVFFSSEFDRGISDPPNILCKVIDIDAHMNYELACSVGILDKYMARNAFQIVKETVDFQISRDKMISPREAVRLLSIGNGQGFIYCNCTGQCKTGRCKCFKMKLKSKCHQSNKNCANVD